ncbi:hypothetical protein CBS101457_006543 [Exobasidium rhododendri]|nr:hypothetical protein CBS101457_006543 [Exobasidium rhododendri]
MSVPDSHLSPSEGSKFKRFLKRFGRRASDETRRAGGPAGEVDEEEEEVNHEEAQQGTTAIGSGGAATTAPIVDGTALGSKKPGSMRSRKGSKSGGAGATNTVTTKGKRSDSIAGRFFQTSANAPPLPSSPSQQKNNISSGVSSAAASPTISTARPGSAFGGTGTEGLANTLTIPQTSSSPAPQLSGVPRHEPIATGDLMSSAGKSKSNTGLSTGNGVRSSSQMNGQPSLTAAENSHGNMDQSNGVARQSSYDSVQSRRQGSSEIDSAEGGIRERDSLDNRTMDTGKSRASTKPTTLMSQDAPENANGSFMSSAQIAQHRHGEVAAASPRVASLRSSNSEGLYSPSIQFAPQAPLGRTISGTIVQLPGSVEEVPYMNVPTLSRPHPSNNPMPGGMPADNASILTLASSTAAASIGGGAASSRGGHSHATPSLGGARSIGGSMMGERRTSSDTYASVKALPPMSRRGSDSSSRTSKSVAASATGRSSAQAMLNAAPVASMAAPGAPSDRISLHRTASQRTIATQLSIPISTSNQINAFDGNSTPQIAASSIAGAETTATNSISNLPNSITPSPSQQLNHNHELIANEALKAHVDQLAAIA